MKVKRQVLLDAQKVSIHSAGIAECGKMLKKVSQTLLHKVIVRVRMFTLVTIVISLFFSVSCYVQAQTPYYYYLGNNKIYLELDTKYAFVSVADKDTMNVFTSKKLNYKSLRADIPEKIQSENKNRQKRFWYEKVVFNHRISVGHLVFARKNTGTMVFKFEF